MKQKLLSWQIVGGVLLSFGILLGFAINSVIVWGDLEATVFTNGINGESSFKNLNCPVIITPKETGTVSVVIKNPVDKMSDRYLRAFITEGYATLVREIKTKISLSPKGKQKVEWKVYPEDAAFERVILFRVYMNAKYPYPSMSGNCGIIKIGIPWLRGDQILAIASGMSLSSFALGAVVINVRGTSKKKKVNSTRNAAYILAVCLFITAVLSYFGFWLLGLMGLTVAIILVGLIIFHR
jgi:hypothetical protein